MTLLYISKRYIHFKYSPDLKSMNWPIYFSPKQHMLQMSVCVVCRCCGVSHRVVLYLRDVDSCYLLSVEDHLKNGAFGSIASVKSGSCYYGKRSCGKTVASLEKEHPAYFTGAVLLLMFARGGEGFSAGTGKED